MFVFTLPVFALFLVGAGDHPKPATLGPAIAPHKALVTRYCAGCHNSSRAAGGLDITRLSLAQPERNAPEWEKTLVKLHTGLMPPAGAPRPGKSAVKDFAAYLETRIDRAAALHANPGRPALHRLNRTEYANAVRDLLDVDVDAGVLLPPDDMSHGFDNMAEVLNVSPTLLAGYVRAAGKISRTAVGEPHSAPVEEIYHLPSALSQTRHIEGTPLGTRGGIALRHTFPADGEYIFRLTLYFTTNTFLFGMYQQGEQIEVAIDGERAALFNVNPMMKGDDDLHTPPIKVKAGPHSVTAAFLQKADGPVEDFVEPFEHSLGDLFLGRTQGLTGLPHLRDVAIKGPYNPTGVSETPSRMRIFICRPKTAAEELPCATRILSSLARQAFRRPITDADTRDLLAIYRTGRAQGDFEDGIRLGVQFIVANPQFVFRFERIPPGAKPGDNYRLTDFELASRLSFFLWSSGPDSELLDLAVRGKLSDPAVLKSQVRRMLADPCAEALATNFAGQWLHLRNLKEIQPDLFAFPNANRNLLDSMRRETELFFLNLAQSDRSVMDLLNADYTFVDETLARHYGIPDVEGARFRRVRLTDENRRGLLGQASILTVTSFANRTSPVSRGKWILDTLLGAPPPKQPANVPPLKESSEGVLPRTVRERLEEHRSNPACASCHTMMDPPGFALECFDATGAWRRRDSGFPIDAHGRLVDGTPVDGPSSLRKALEARSDAFLSAFTQKLLTYALGRGVEYYDMPAVREIDRQAALNGSRFSSYVLGIVTSIPFQMRRAARDRPSDGTTVNVPWPEGHISGGLHVYHQKASLAPDGPSRARRLTGAAVSRVHGRRADPASQDGHRAAHTARGDRDGPRGGRLHGPRPGEKLLVAREGRRRF